jgi:dipeptidyl aminopeptidase/acylaminoacyl peptidase
LLKRVGLVIVGLLAIAVVILGIVGVPAPPAATVSGAPRVPWSVAWDGIGEALRDLEATSFVAWDPRGGIIIRGNDGLSPRLMRVTEPNASPDILPLPERVGTLRFDPDPTKGYAVYTKDEGGDENHQIFRWDLDTDAQTRLTDGESRHALGPFSRDGTWLAFTSSRRNGKDEDIYVIDPRDPSSERVVAEVEGSWTAADWSPSGTRLLVRNYLSSAESRPYVLDVDSGEMQPAVALAPAASFSDLSWGADEHTIFLVTDRGDEFTRLMRVDLRTQEMTPLGEPFGWDVTHVDGPIDRSRLLVVVNEDGYDRHHLVDPASGQRQALALPDGFASGLVMHREGARIGFTLTAPGGVAATWTYDVDAQQAEPWTTAPSSDDAPLPRERIVRYSTFDERRIPTFVYDPPDDAPRPAPVLIRIHGGPASQSRAGSNAVFDAARRDLGLAVFAPNVRGSTGYGKTYQTLDDARLREDSVRDIGALLDFIAADPDYDENRVIVYGGSYGGYMVLASMVHYADRIRCGVDTVGISNWVTFLANTSAYRQDLRRAEYGDERDPTTRAFLEAISPANRADEIAGKLLIIQGENDPRVPVTESRQIVDRLRELGRDVWYAEFADEGHGIRLPLNAAYTAVLGFTFAQECL